MILLWAPWEVFGRIVRSDWNVSSNSCDRGQKLWRRNLNSRDTQKSACLSARTRFILKDQPTKGLTSECCVVNSLLHCLGRALSESTSSCSMRVWYFVFFRHLPLISPERTAQLGKLHTLPRSNRWAALTLSTLLYSSSFYLIFSFSMNHFETHRRGIYRSTFWPLLPLLAQPPLFQQLPVCRQGDSLRKWVTWPSLCWPGCFFFFFFSKCISCSEPFIWK